MRTNKRSIASFTLTELLIVIAMIAVIATAVILVLDPGEYLAQARDAQRVVDIDSLNTAVGLYASSVRGSKGVANKVYISIPSANADCSDITGLPTLPVGSTYVCATDVDYRKVNGSGWLPVNFEALPGGSTIKQLPIDPQNSTASGRYYIYMGDANGYEVVSLLESEKQLKAKALKDGGADSSRYESGSALSYWTTTSGIVTYWSLDGSGSISSGQTAGLQDLSGNNKNGVASNANGSIMSFVLGKQGSAVIFDGIDDWIDGMVNPAIGINPNVFTVFGIINPDNQASKIITPSSVGIDQSIGYDSANGRIYIQVAESSDTNQRNRYSTSGSVPIGGWTQWAISLNDKNIKIYINGKLNAEYNEVISIANWTGTWRVGQRGNSTSWYKGIMDEVRVYNRILSETEIISLYKASR